MIDGKTLEQWAKEKDVDVDILEGAAEKLAENGHATAFDALEKNAQAIMQKCVRMTEREEAEEMWKLQSTSVEENPIKDSGLRRSYVTGSVRDVRTGKGRFDLISPIALRRLAVHLENGARKYDERNWEKGQPLMDYIDSAMRHIASYVEGYRDEDHMAAALWNIHGFIHTEELISRGVLPNSLDNRPVSMIREK